MVPLFEICSPFENEKKAIMWLYGFSMTQDWMSIESNVAMCKNPDDFPVIDFQIHLKAKSERRYKINGRIMQTEFELAQIQPIQVFGTSAETNEHTGVDEWCHLCINTSEYGELLPLGDQLISMTMALHDDIALSKLLPLLELFLAHGKEEYQWIQAYLSDGIVLEQSDQDIYKLIPEDIRYLDHHFSCMEDQLQYVGFSEEEKQAIYDEEFRHLAEKVRQKKQNHH